MSEQEEKAVEGAEGTERDYAAEASQQGWTDQDSWVASGKPADKWKDAKTFVEDGEKIAGLQKKKAQREIELIRKELSEVKRNADLQRKAALEAMKAQKEAHEQELKARRASAIARGEGDKVNELDDELQEVRDEKRAAAAELKKLEERDKQAPIINPAAFQVFLKSNRWYDSNSDEFDAVRASKADVRFHELIAEGMDGTSALTTIIDEFSEKPPQRKPQSPEGGSRGKAKESRTVKSLEDLPEEDRKIAKEFADMIPVGKARDEYISRFLKNYQSQ